MFQFSKKTITLGLAVFVGAAAFAFAAAPGFTTICYRGETRDVPTKTLSIYTDPAKTSPYPPATNGPCPVSGT